MHDGSFLATMSHIRTPAKTLQHWPRICYKDCMGPSSSKAGRMFTRNAPHCTGLWYHGCRALRLSPQGNRQHSQRTHAPSSNLVTGSTWYLTLVDATNRSQVSTATKRTTLVARRCQPLPTTTKRHRQKCRGFSSEDATYYGYRR